MATYLCAQCYLNGYCRELTSREVESHYLTPQYIRDIRDYARSLGIKPDQWKDYLLAAYRDYPGRIVDFYGDEIALDTSVFDPPEIRTWFRDLCRPVPPGTLLRIRRESRKRFMVMATILRARDPVAANWWGARVANDNPRQAPLPPKPGSCECPYRHLSYDRPRPDVYPF